MSEQNNDREEIRRQFVALQARQDEIEKRVQNREAVHRPAIEDE